MDRRPPPRCSSDLQEDVLNVEHLNVRFPKSRRSYREVVQDVSLTIHRGEVLGLVGESGSGKTMTALSIMGLAQAKGATVSASSIRLAGREVSNLSRREWSEVRGRQIGMIFQQPIRSLNPAYTVGEQIAEVVRRHTNVGRTEAMRRAVEMLDRVRIADAARRASEYPHTFSGGMCQRVMIAMALVCEPMLLIADEPTTALDVTVQAKVLDLLRELQRESGVAILFITHDLGVISEICDRVSVMYAGQVVEEATVDGLFGTPRHPYTRGLLRSIPVVGESGRLSFIPGAVPGAGQMPTGCRFHPRCEHAVEGRCDTGDPPLISLDDARSVRCVRHAELTMPPSGD